MPSEITMPQLSDTMTEGTVVKWHKKEGESVKSGEELADIETDKATMPMEAFEAGTVAFIAAQEGQKVKVGDLLAVIATSGENPAEVKKQAQERRAASPQPTPAATTPTVESHGGRTPEDQQQGSARVESQFAKASREVSERGAHPSSPAPATTSATATAPRDGDGQRGVRISPLARRIAQDKGIDIGQLRGSGPGGRIIERDIEAFVAEGGGARPSAPSPSRAAPSAAPSLAPIVLSGQKRIVTMTKMRSAIAAALQRSKQIIPHFYETIDIELDAMMKVREKLNERLEKENIRISIADFVVKAVATCLLQYPMLNARFNADKGEITQYGDVNMGIAVSIPDGLIVPVLRGVNQMGLRDIRIRTADLVDRARQQRLKREEQTEATFTISSLGTYGVREFSAIINPPEVGILAVGAAAKQPVVRGDQIVPRTMLSVTLSADHRVVDGATAAEFLTALKATLEEPAMMLV